MKDLLCIHCYVSGKVQGVWFRASTKTEADKLQLTGWVRNLPDGRVEVLACGKPEQVKAFYIWLQKGPELAKVTGVEYSELEPKEHAGFNII
jgi:acylphosphatase